MLPSFILRQKFGQFFLESDVGAYLVKMPRSLLRALSLIVSIVFSAVGVAVG